MSMIENLDFIKEQGIEPFLKVQEEKWLCPVCGGTISCHGGQCFKCGIEKLKAKKKGRYRCEE
jgi:ribosomal protein L40E